ncbi:MAG: glycosyltransferase family 2 protein [Oscillospiraceae bacterium]|nr:glycosyltransferase family 2 protein [Oscillospiraceae bacterium]
MRINKLSIVIPVYYNEGELLPLYSDLKEKTLDKLNCDYEIVMVDDGSKDNSYFEMCSLAKIDPKIKLLKLSRNFGEHAATLAGLAKCTGDCAVRKAADLQEPSELILDLIEKYEEGHNIVLANREGRDEPITQKCFSSIYNCLMRKFALENMPKGGFDSYLIDRQVIDLIVSMNEKNTPVTEQILWCGFDPVSVGYIRQKRKIGKSHWTLSKKIKLSLDSMLGFSYVPIRFIFGIGILSFLCSLIWIFVVFIFKLLGKIDVDGYTSIVMLLLLSFGIIMLSLGILGEYVWRMFDAIRNRPPYIINKKPQNLENQNIKNKD